MGLILRLNFGFTRPLMVVGPVATLAKPATVEAFCFTQEHLFLFGELREVAAFMRAGMGVLRCAGGALDE